MKDNDASLENYFAERRRDFPILGEKVNGHPVVFLDSGASSQKPQRVINRITEIYSSCYANVHRGAYHFSEKTTADYENSRRIIAEFLNASSPNEIVFTSSTTAAINLVAYAYGRGIIQSGQRVIISEMEHHSNIVPWQMLALERDIHLDIAKVKDNGELDIEYFADLLRPDTALVAITHVSNVLGTINPVEKIIQLAHDAGAKVLLDGSQAVMHQTVDVTALDVDFYVFTGHKIYGPTGIGILYGKSKILHEMPPFMGGGDMITHVSFDQTIYAEPPARFEAGTPPIAQAIALGEAVEYVREIGLDSINSYEKTLLDYGSQILNDIQGCRVIGQAQNKTAIFSIVIEGAHPHDIATVLDQQGIAVRAGHHCAEPLMKRFGVVGTTRASMALYNNRDDIDALAIGLEKAIKLLL